MSAASSPSDRKFPTAGQLRLRKRADARRVEILRAAARIFRERGIGATGMREIALAADLSPGNLYHYFRGKDEILFFCQDQALDRLIAALTHARKGRGQIATRLQALARAHVLCLLDEVEGSAAHLEVDALPPTMRRAIVGKRDTYERGVRSLVAAGIRRGELRRTDPTVATRAFLGALNWTVQWFRPEGSQPPERVAELVSDYAVTGLGARIEELNEATRAHRAHRQRRGDAGRLRAV
jgi:AcrR family transcriptional regulator